MRKYNKDKQKTYEIKGNSSNYKSNYKDSQSKDNNTSSEKILNFSLFNTKILEEINLARTNPSTYAAKLERISTTIHNNKLKVGNKEMKLQEGSKIFDEAIQYLLNISPIEPLTVEEGLCQSAEELLSVLIIQEGVNMRDLQSNIYDLEKRLDHFGVYFGEFCELLDYGCLDPEFVVINFILGDGDEFRKDRKIIFNPDLKYMGITSGILPSSKKVTIINFVQFYYKPGEEIPETTIERFTYHPNMKEKIRQMKEQSAENFYDKRDQYKQHFEMFNTSTEKSMRSIKEEDEDVNNGKKVKKIKKITKKIKDKLTGKEIITVKTIITYKDGEEDVENYIL